MAQQLRVLLLEDRQSDAELILAELRRAGFTPEVEVVSEREPFRRLVRAELDVILADFNLPQFNALEALSELAATGVDVPLIVVTGTLSDRAAVDCIRMGAADYLLKDRLARLGEAITRALEQRRLRAEARQAQEALDRSRQRLEAIFSRIRDAVLVVDDDGHIIDANPAAGHMTGYPIAELQARALNMLFAGEGDDAGPLPAIEISGAASGEAAFRRQDGEMRQAEYDLVPEITSGLHLIVLRDITDQRRTELALRDAQKRESLAVLAGGVAHDLNNLLVAVLLNADVALAEISEGQLSTESIEQVKVAAVRAADLARQLLAFSGRGSTRKEAFSVSAAVQEMAQLLHASIAPGATLEYEPSPRLPVIDADATQIRQILLNLVVNASDAIGDQRGMITIGTGVTRVHPGEAETRFPMNLQPGDYVYVEVGDTGRGMDAATRARIFDPFFTTKPTGRGLGLSAVLGIVEAHGGAMTVSSAPGHGSTFRFLLPVIDTGTGTASQPLDAPRGDWRASGRALVADDDGTVRILTARALESLGFTVDLAADGREAIAMFAQDPEAYALVVLDIAMPRLSGVDALLQLRQIRPDIAAVLMSGYGESALSGQFTDQSAVRFLAKPFEMNALRGVVRSVLPTGS